MGAVEEMGREMYYFDMQCLKLDEHNIAMRVRDSIQNTEYRIRIKHGNPNS